MFFGTWSSLGCVLVIRPLACIALMPLRISGKRTLTKLNAFDFVVTIALGSTLAIVLLSQSASLAEGVLALAILTVVQFIITWSSVRFERVQQFIQAEPTLLLHRGRFPVAAMRAQRVTRKELLAVFRPNGKAEPDAVAGVVLETDGSFSVPCNEPLSPNGALTPPHMSDRP